MDIAPDAGVAVEAPRRVVEMDEGGPRVEGRCICADDSLAEIGELQALVLQVALDELGNTPIKEQSAQCFVAADAVFEPLARGWVADPQVALTGRAQSVAQAGHYVLHGTPARH